MKKVDLLLFDFDGTLIDSGADLVASVAYTLKTLNLPPRTPEEIISFVGDGVRQLLQSSLGEPHKELLPAALDIFSSHYEKHLMDATLLYPHVEEMLQYFSATSKIILTNKRDVFARRIAQVLDIEKYFLEIIGADSTLYQKPDRRVVDCLLEKYQVAPDKTVMVGDGINDIAVAKNAGICSCAYLNGLGDRETLLRMKADFYCEDLSALKDIFLK